MRVFDAGEDPSVGGPFLVLESVKGTTLKHVLRERGPDTPLSEADRCQEARPDRDRRQRHEVLVVGAGRGAFVDPEVAVLVAPVADLDRAWVDLARRVVAVARAVREPRGAEVPVAIGVVCCTRRQRPPSRCSSSRSSGTSSSPRGWVLHLLELKRE